MRSDRAREGRPTEGEAPQPERDARTEVEEPGDPDTIEPKTVWRADHERVATGPLRAHGTDVYNPEDEPLQDVIDRPARSTETTRGHRSGDATGLSSSDERDAMTGSGPEGA